MSRHALRLLLFALGAALMVVLLDAPAFAQCAMCRASVTAAAENRALSKGINLGVLVLLVPPVTIFCSIFFLAFKNRGRDETRGPKE